MFDSVVYITSTLETTSKPMLLLYSTVINKFGLLLWTSAEKNNPFYRRYISDAKADILAPLRIMEKFSLDLMVPTFHPRTQNINYSELINHKLIKCINQLSENCIIIENFKLI